jgi:hypothetical protein
LQDAGAPSGVLDREELSLLDKELYPFSSRASSPGDERAGGGLLFVLAGGAARGFARHAGDRAECPGVSVSALPRGRPGQAEYVRPKPRHRLP